MGGCLSYFNCIKAPGHSKPKPAVTGADGLEHDGRPPSRSRGIEPDAPHKNGDGHTATEPDTTSTPSTGVPAPAGAPGNLVNAGGEPDSSGGIPDTTAQETEAVAVSPPERTDTIEIIIDPNEDPLGRGPYNPPVHSGPRPATGSAYPGRPPQGPRK